MTSPSNTWSTDKPHNLRPTLGRKNSVDSSKLKSPITSGSILKPVKITPGNGARAASESPVGTRKTSTTTEKSKDKVTKESKLKNTSNAAPTGIVGKDIKQLPDCKVLLTDITKNGNLIKEKEESTQRIVVTDTAILETEETQDTNSNQQGVTEAEVEDTEESKDTEEILEAEYKGDLVLKEEDKSNKKQEEETDNEEEEESEEEKDEQEEEEEEDDDETQARNLEELFDGQILTVSKDGKALPPPPIYRILTTPEKQRLIEKNCRPTKTKSPVAKERASTATASKETVQENRKCINISQGEEDMADRGLVPQTFTGSEDAEHWLETIQLWLTFRDFTGEKALAAVKLLLKGGAWQWYIGLDENKKSNLGEFEKAFRDRYMTAHINKWKDQTQVMDLIQGIQSVDDYITDAQNKRRKTEMPDELFKAIVIRGLRQHIRQQVMQHEPQTVEDIRKWGVVAETSEDTKDSTSDMTAVMKALMELKADQKELKAEATRARSSHAIHAVGSPGNSRPTTPKVQFQETAQAAYYMPSQPVTYQQNGYGQGPSDWQAQQMQPTNNYDYGYYEAPEYNNYGNQESQPRSGGWRGRGRGAGTSSTRYGNQPQTRFDSSNTHSNRGARLYNNTQRGGYQPRGGNEQSSTASACWNCGSTTRHGKDNCPAKDRRCVQCGKIGHFKSVCRSGQRQY